MAQKKGKFDADSFLDNYEETVSAPVSQAQPAPQPQMVKAKPEAMIEDSKSKKELEYMELFILRTKYSRMSRKGKQVPISEEFKKKIQRIMVFFSECGTITEYVNNVLEQHFKEYDDVIRRMSDNNLKL